MGRSIGTFGTKLEEVTTMARQKFTVSVPYGEATRRKCNKIQKTGSYHVFRNRKGKECEVRTREDAVNILKEMYGGIFQKRYGSSENFDDCIRDRLEPATETKSVYLVFPIKD